MTPKHIRTVPAEKGKYGIYLLKARDFYDTMLGARDREKWTAVGLNAVHCAISCCDAMLVFHLGLRSAGENHNQATDLLSRLPQALVDNEINAFKRIIAKKNIIAYEGRTFYQKEALEALKLAERFYDWTIKNLPR